LIVIKLANLLYAFTKLGNSFLCSQNTQLYRTLPGPRYFQMLHNIIIY